MDTIRKLELKEAKLQKELKELDIQDKRYGEKLNELTRISCKLLAAELKKNESNH